jgi:hypothetical protein
MNCLKAEEAINLIKEEFFLPENLIEYSMEISNDSLPIITCRYYAYPVKKENCTAHSSDHYLGAMNYPREINTVFFDEVEPDVIY